MKRDIAVLLLVLAGVAALFRFRSHPAAPTLVSTPGPAAPNSDDHPAGVENYDAPPPMDMYDVGGIHLETPAAEVEKLLGPPRKKDDRWHYGHADNTRVQTISFGSRHEATCITGSALSWNGHVLAQTGTPAAEVRESPRLGKPHFTHHWNKDAEDIWGYRQEWGTLELHMARDDSRVLHVRIYTKD